MVLRAQVQQELWGTASNRHVVTTTHWIAADPVNQDALDEIAARLVAAYDIIEDYRSQLGTPARLLIYDLDEPEPRLPIYDELLTAGVATGNQSIPAQVCAVLSYRGQYSSGTNRARRRGRMFIGPLAPAAIAIPTNPNPVLLSTDFVGFLLDFGQALATPIGSEPVLWAQYSPTDAVPHVVTEISVDRSPDIQRSRKPPGNRTSEPVSQPL